MNKATVQCKSPRIAKLQSTLLHVVIHIVNNKSLVEEKFHGSWDFIILVEYIFAIKMVLIKLVGKTFTVRQKSTKTTKVFSC